jgi:hypothetical protein
MKAKGFCFFFLLTTFLLISNSGWADGIVDDVSVIPASPTTEESVTVIISGTLASTLDSACFEEMTESDEGPGNHRIVIYLSHVEHVDVDLPTARDFQIKVPLGRLEKGVFLLSVVTQHTLLTSPPLVYSTLDTLVCFAVSCTSSVNEETIPGPAEFTLHQNCPNPFNQSTKIEFSLAKSGFVKFNVYDILGRKVRTLISEHLSSGYNSVLWDGKNDSGKDVASGIYFYQIKVEEFTETKKLVLMK